MNSIPKKAILVTTFFIGSRLSSYAQPDFSKYEVGINAGSFIYQGDLTPSALGSFKTWKPAFGISLSRILNRSFSVRLNLALGEIKGDDAKYSSPAWRQQRNFNFNSPLTEVSAMMVWNVLGKNGDEFNSGISPYLFAGIGYSFLNIKRDWSNMNTTVFSPESAVQAGLVQDAAHSLPNAIPVLPLGIGVRYSLSPHISVDAESSYRFTFTDYLDGFSQSANPSKKDHYYSHSIGIIYSFIKKNIVRCPVIRY